MMAWNPIIWILESTAKSDHLNITSLHSQPLSQNLLSGLWIIWYAGQLQTIRSLPSPVAGKHTNPRRGRHPVSPVWLAHRSNSGKPDRRPDLFLGGPVHLHIPVTCRTVGSQRQYRVRGLWKDCTWVPSGQIRRLRQDTWLWAGIQVWRLFEKKDRRIERTWSKNRVIMNQKKLLPYPWQTIIYAPRISIHLTFFRRKIH